MGNKVNQMIALAKEAEALFVRGPQINMEIEALYTSMTDDERQEMELKIGQLIDDGKLWRPEGLARIYPR